MGDVATPASIRTLVEEFGDPDYRKRDVAASSLRKIPEARNVLLKESRDVAKTQAKLGASPSCCRRSKANGAKIPSTALWKRLQQAIAAEERIQTAFLHVLKSADVEFVYDRLAEQGVKLVKEQKIQRGVGIS